MPDFTQFNKQPNNLNESVEKENTLYEEQRKKEISIDHPQKNNIPMPKAKKEEKDEPLFIRIKNKDKLQKLAKKSNISMKELVEFWIDNAEL
ncbi:RepB family protein [Enterococcus sp. AZ166]|uniref:RepB family protein n=1 Tax=Enterococcus sp. AZ166 TaxID=2774860 RepID=UPI00370E4846